VTEALVTVMAASVREEVADFVGALVTVYLLLIIAYILSQLYFGFGGRMPYSRWSSASSASWTRPSRRTWRSSAASSRRSADRPVAHRGIFLLQIVGRIVVGLIRG
jgi:hypothetical protein